MAPRYPVFTQNNNKVLNDLKKLDGFGEELEALIGEGAAADGISAADVANYLTQLGVKTGEHDVALADRVSKAALDQAGLLQVINKTTGGDAASLGESELAQYLERNTQVVNDHTYFLDNSAVSKEKFSSLTAAFTEFKNVEFNLPVTPAPSTNVFAPPAVNSGYIQVRDDESLTVNALVSMYNRGVINGSWDVEFINAPDDNGFVRNVDNMLTGVDVITPSDANSSARHLMSVKPEKDFTLEMSFMVKDASTFSEFFMYNIVQNSGDTGAPFTAKFLDINSAVSTNAYTPRSLVDIELAPLDTTKLSPNVFYDIKIIRVGTSMSFTITGENSNYIGSGSTETSSGEIKWGLLNNKNVSVRNIRMNGVTWFIGNGEDLSDDFGAYKIQAGLNNNDFVVTYYVNEGSFFEVISVNGTLVESKLKSQYGSSNDIQTSADLKFVYAKTDVQQHYIYDVTGLIGRADGLLAGSDQLDLTSTIDSIEKVNDTDRHKVDSLAHYIDDSGKNVVIVQGTVVALDSNQISLGPNAMFTIKIVVVDPGTSYAVSTTRYPISLPSQYSFGDNNLHRMIDQSPRNDSLLDLSNGLILKDTFFHIVTGMKSNSDTGKDETQIFILKDGKLVATIPVKDKLNTKPLDRSFYSTAPTTDDPWGVVVNYNEVILLGSQLFIDGASTPYLYLCYGADSKGAPFGPAYSEIVRSNNYQKLCRIDIQNAVFHEQTTGNPLELNTDDAAISYFAEDPSLVNEPKDYISPMSSYPYGQHINITSRAMVCVNRQNYFMRNMSLFELDVENLYFKNRVDYESSVNEDRRPGASWMDRLLPFRVAISKDYLNVIGAGNPLYSVSLESSFSKGRTAALSEHLHPIEILPEASDTDFLLSDLRVSTLDPLPVPLWYSFNRILPLSDANSDLTNETTISVNIDGTMTVNGETYTYDFGNERYTSTTNPDNYYTKIDSSTITFDWNSNIGTGLFNFAVASSALGGETWLAFKAFDPQWEFEKYAIDTLNDYVADYYPDISHETNVVPGYPNLVYYGLGTALAFAAFWGNEILGNGPNGWQSGWGTIEISTLDPQPA